MITGQKGRLRQGCREQPTWMYLRRPYLDSNEYYSHTLCWRVF